jgi:hypothetical protein
MHPRLWAISLIDWYWYWYWYRYWYFSEVNLKQQVISINLNFVDVTLMGSRLFIVMLSHITK